MTRVRTGCGAMLGAVLMVMACGRQPPTPTPVGPLVNFVSPSFALAGVSTPIQIHGLGFQPGATVRIDGVGVAATVETPLRITATAPPHELGDVEIVVTNPDGRAARLPRGLKYITAHQVPGAGDLRIRPGESVTSALDSLCTIEGVPCRRLVLDAAPQETIELEVSSLEPTHQVGLFATEPTRSPDSYPRTLLITGGQRAFILGEATAITVTAWRPGTTHAVSWSAGDACPALPSEASQRRYDATIANGVVTLRTGSFMEGPICTSGTGLGCNQFRIEQNGDDAHVSLINPTDWHGGQIIERLSSGGWVTLTGTGTGRVQGTTIRALMDANLWYCPVNASAPFPCESSMSCRVQNLELTITGR